jgi:hypothetical protein
MKKIKLFAGFALLLVFALTNISALENEIPDNCLVWFDGCNTCVVSDNGAVGCTKKYCEIYEPSECREYKENEIVVCTADSMQCPDGSWVGRTAPDCKFICPDIGIVDDSVDKEMDVILPEKTSLITRFKNWLKKLFR